MLDLRIYRAAFVPILLVLAVVAFSLQTRPGPMTSDVAPDAFDAARAFRLLGDLSQRYPDRAPGSQGDLALAGAVQRTFQAAGFEVSTTDTTAETIDGERTLRTVVAARPGSVDRALVVLAHRDAATAPAKAQLSATAALMEAVRVLKDLPLKKDVWLVHLTGEEFPADGLGTRALAKALVNGEPLIEGRPNPRIAGMFVLDMVAHHTDRKPGAPEPARAILQISPGRGKAAATLALTAHRAALTWNERMKQENWDEQFQRKATWKRYQIPRRKGPLTFPDPVLGKYLPLSAEIRPDWHLRSSLYNTDAQIYSDMGIPVVLFMENYDINRKGYHDTQDTIENIDLDFGRGVVSIAIEAVAQAALR